MKKLSPEKFQMIFCLVTKTVCISNKKKIVGNL